ncbi:MAG TPA: glycine zipper 2TM domain-containing protein [Paucimonas sp.]|nr:glycine zipper 2TM domain-containing protein [Paucimonas sp.]
METNNVPNRIHPLVAVAAVSVTLVSLAGVAAITGLLPSSHGTDTPLAPLAAAPAATATPVSAAAPAPVASAAATGDVKTSAAAAEAAEEAPKKSAQRQAQVVKSQHTQPRASQRSGSTSVAKADICSNCGRIESIETIRQQAQPSGLGVAAGAVLGGVLGNQIGDGNGRKLATIAGAVGGGYAGNEIEKRTRGTTTYKIRVRMEDGSTRTFPYTTQPSWNEGDRVRVVNGELTGHG